MWFKSWSSLVSIRHDCSLPLLSITSALNCKFESLTYSEHKSCLSDVLSSYEFLRSKSRPNNGFVSKSGFESMNWWTTEQTCCWIGRIFWHKDCLWLGRTCSARLSKPLKSALSLWTVCKPLFCSLRRRCHSLLRRNCQTKTNQSTGRRRAQSRLYFIRLTGHHIWANGWLSFISHTSSIRCLCLWMASKLKGIEWSVILVTAISSLSATPRALWSSGEFALCVIGSDDHWSSEMSQIIRYQLNSKQQSYDKRSLRTSPTDVLSVASNHFQRSLLCQRMTINDITKKSFQLIGRQLSNEKRISQTLCVANLWFAVRSDQRL